MTYRFIAVEGNIGAGKTALATRLSRDLNARLILEEFEDNAFLPKFYQNPDRYAFPVELSFLAARFHQLKKQLYEQDIFRDRIISDYIFHKSKIFSRVNLKEDEYDLYLKLFDIINFQLPQPDLLIYLNQPITGLRSNIKKRGRQFEQNIQDHYLEEINHGYRQFIYQNQHLKILSIDMSQVDFVNNESDYKKILDSLEQSYTVGINQFSR